MSDLLPPEMLNMLRALDPVGNRPAVTLADLSSAEEKVMNHAEADTADTGLVDTKVDTELVELVPPSSTRSGRYRLTSTRLSAAVAACVLVAGLGLTVTHLRHSEPAAPSLSLDSSTILVPARYHAIAQRLLPLSADMSVDCLGAVVPVAVLAAPGGAEKGTDPVSTALRDFLAHNHSIAGVQPLTGGNWLLLSQTAKRLVFGQRHGVIGVRTALALTRHGPSVSYSSSGGCGRVVTGSNQQGEGFRAESTKGTTLTLRWATGSNCGSGPAKTDRVVSRVVVQQNAHTVHLLLLSKPSPDTGPVTGACIGVGITATATVHLSEPLGRRTLYDDSSTPVTVIKPT